MSRMRRYNPMADLIRSIRVAAAQIDIPRAREIAAREAERIPLTMTEKAHGAKAKVAGLARAQMKALPGLSPEALPDAVDVLRGCADALDSRFEVTSETHLVGRSGRRNAAQAGR